MSFLVVDVGNTRLKWAVYAQAHPEAALLGSGAAVLEAIDGLAQVHWRGMQPPLDMLGCVVAGDAVRVRVEEQMAQAWGLGARWVMPGERADGVHNGYDHPRRLGADRWAALLGARHRALAHAARTGQPVRPAVVAMVGTAVTVDALDADGHFLGGLILPGFGLMLRALELGTAGLKVPSGEVCDFPTNTSDALISGGADAIAGALERLHRRLARRCGVEPHLMISGGAAAKLAPGLDLDYEMVETLIFEGLLALAAESASSGGGAASGRRSEP